MSPPIAPSPAQEGDIDSGSLDDLRDRLKEEQDHGAQLQREQADNKVEQDSLKGAIDKIAKYLDEFKKDGDGLRREYLQTRSQVNHRLQCVAELLGPLQDQIDRAIDDVGRHTAQQAQAATHSEEVVAGPADLEARNKARESVRSQSAFDQLAVKAMKDRVAAAAKYLSDANAITGDTPPELAAAYALLKLAYKRLAKTWLFSDIGFESVPFDFPDSNSEYERMLVAAYFAALRKLQIATASRTAFEKAKADFDANLKRLADLRASFKDDVVEAAQNAATSYSASAKAAARASAR